jgi:predicted nucleic acid-binding protein
VKLVVREAETDALLAFLTGAEIVSSEIAEIEVPRAAYLRTSDTDAIAHAEVLLRRFHLVTLDDDLRREAARARPPELRTLDAVHLVSCLRLRGQLASLVAYDRRLSEAARAHGLLVAAPS